MKKTSNPIVFFGSGPVAAAALTLLVEDFDIEAVITKPRAEHHKGSVPVLDLCEKLKLPLHTPANKKELSDLFDNKIFSSKLGLVIDYGIIINKDVIDSFSFGIINSHFSLLPEWRGADPITFAILSGQKETGVSIMLINEKMDEGPLLGVGLYDIKEGETSLSLTDHLITVSHGLLTTLIPSYLEGDIHGMSQEFVADSLHRTTEPTYSRKLTKDDSVIVWTKPAEQIEREIRGFIGWPGSRTTLFKKDILITQAEVVPVTGVAGTVIRDKKELTVHCGEHALRIIQLKPAGKKEMPIAAFLAGIPADLLS